MKEDLHCALDPSGATVNGKRITFIVYILQASGLFVGLPLIAGVTINYVKRADVKGSWLESHFRWQIRTFWFSLLFAFIGIATYIFLIGYFILIADGIWMIYRIVKGLLYLNEEREMYQRS